MKLRMTRDTGFYGMGSPLQIVIDGKVAAHINHQEVKEIQLEDQPATIQVKFYFLKSPVYQLDPSVPIKSYTIVMNLQLVRIYILLFLAMILLPFLFRSLLFVLIFLVGYIILFSRMMGKAYVLKEDHYGAQRGDLYQ
ncbi:MAG: hypothetical protein ACK5NA_02410 [Enterococcus sp.]